MSQAIISLKLYSKFQIPLRDVQTRECSRCAGSQLQTLETFGSDG